MSVRNFERSALVLVFLGVAGCEPAATTPPILRTAAEPPIRSPSLDYPPPDPVDEFNGETLGADRRAPRDTLKEGVQVGTPGITPSEGPKFGAEHEPELKKPAPCAEIGLQDEQGNSPCKPAASPP